MSLEAIGDRKVRAVIRKDGPEASAFFDFVAETRGKRLWTLGEWQALLAELDACELTVDEFRLTN